MLVLFVTLPRRFDNRPSDGSSLELKYVIFTVSLTSVINLVDRVLEGEAS